MHTLIHLVIVLGYPGVFAYMLVSAFVPIPSEAALPLVGAMIATRHAFNLNTVVIAGSLGSLAGSLIAYAIGARTGPGIVARYGRWLLLQPRDIERAERWFARYGDAAVFFGRLIPLVRAVISYPAGTARMHLGKFCAFSFLGGLAWCYALTWAGIQLGAQYRRIGVYTHVADVAIAVVVVLGAVVWIKRHTGDHVAPDAETAPVES